MFSQKKFQEILLLHGHLIIHNSLYKTPSTSELHEIFVGGVCPDNNTQDIASLGVPTTVAVRSLSRPNSRKKYLEISIPWVHADTVL